MDRESVSGYAGWAIVELMGHRKLAGYVQPEEHYGVTMLRLDVPAAGQDQAATQFYAAAALYCLTPTTEAIATAFAAGTRPRPVDQWDFPAELRVILSPLSMRDGDVPTTVPDDDPELPFD